jgi:hypothetical protein
MASKQRRLREARKKRSQATKVLQRLEAGELPLRALLEARPKSIHPVRVWVLVKHAPHMGEVKTKNVLVRAKVYPLMRVGDLMDGDVQRILEYLPPAVK